MKRTLLALLVTAPFAVQAAPTLYGQLNVSTDIVNTDPDNGEGNTRGYIESNSSRIGVMGEESINKNLRAKYVAEWDVTGDIAGNDFADGGHDLTGRDRYVALESTLGAIRWGAFSTSIKNSQGNVDRFNDLNIADMATASHLVEAANNPNITEAQFDKLVANAGSQVLGLGVTRDTRYSNAVGYTSPKLADAVVFDVMFSPEEGIAATDRTSASLTYDKGAVYAAVGYETQGGDTDAIRVAANFEVTPALQLGALYQTDTIATGNKDESLDAILLSGQYAAANNCVYKAQVGQTKYSETDDSERTVVTVGMDHKLSNNVTLYGLLTNASGDDYSDTGLSAGVKYKF